jgi:hypothetical protein
MARSFISGGIHPAIFSLYPAIFLHISRLSVHTTLLSGNGQPYGQLQQPAGQNGLLLLTPEHRG